MGVKVFNSPVAYSEWVNFYEGPPMEVISVVAHNDQLIVTYKFI